MSGLPRAGVQVALSEPVSALRAVALDRATDWFPDLGGGRVTVDARVLRARPRSTMVLLRLTGGGVSRNALAKLRRDDGWSPPPQRPGFVPVPLAAGEQSALEHAALSRVELLIGTDHPRLRAVRALEHVPSCAGVVMEQLDAAGGRAVLTKASRLRGIRPGPDRQRDAVQLCRGAGEWLRRFHTTTSDYELVDRDLSARDLEALFGELAAYLSLQVGPDAATLARRAGAVVPHVLPGRMPRAVGHGDFAVRNTLLDPDGRVAVIDPMPRWRTPVWEDLARFTVSVRLQGLQVHAQGLAYPSAYLDLLEHELLTGYLGGRPPGDQLRSTVAAAQLLILFDKWSALVSARGTQPRLPRGVPDRAADRYVRREGERLLGLVEAGR